MTADSSLTIPIDHLGIAARSLSPLLAAYTDLGFHITDPGELTGQDADGSTVELGQQSAHIVFQNDYLELSAVPGAPEGHHLSSYLKRFDGLHILAIASENALNTHASLLQDNPDLPPLQQAARMVNYGTAGMARFSWFQLPPADFPEGLICIVEHHSRQTIFQAPVMKHANGATGFAGLLVYSSAPQQSLARFQPLANDLDGHQVQFVTEPPLNNSQLPADPCFYGIGFNVKDINITRQLLSDNNVRFSNDKDKLWVEPSLAGGCAVWFVQES